MQIEDFPGRRRPFAVEQDNIAQTQLGIDPLAIDLAYLAGILHVDAIEYADRLTSNEIAADHPNPAVRHRCIRQTLRQHRLNFEINAAHCVEDAIQRLGIGHPVATVIDRLEIFLAQLLFDLRSRPVHQDQTNAQTDQQIDVVGQRFGKLAGHRLAAESNDKGLAPEGVDVGRDRPEPGDEILVVGGIAHLSPYFPSSSFSAASRRSHTVRRILTRAKFLSFASISVHGAKPVEVRSTMSQTADT